MNSPDSATRKIQYNFSSPIEGLIIFFKSIESFVTFQTENSSCVEFIEFSEYIQIGKTQFYTMKHEHIFTYSKRVN